MTDSHDPTVDGDELALDALPASPSAEIPAELETDWSGDDLEAAYLRALSTLETVETDLAAQTPDQDSSPPDAERQAVEPESPEPMPLCPPVESRAAQLECGADTEPPATRRVNVTPRQILEAILFVGGAPQTAKKLASVLRGDQDVSFIEAAIESLNQQYAAENRPYEIRLGEGGYRLELRPEFDRVRDKVYGLGPKEVRLSQDALEVLALVAYRQPISPEEIEELGKTNAGPVLRQLLRRELIAVSRDPAQPKLVRYRTTNRFLSLFGLGSLDDLPQADELNFK